MPNKSYKEPDHAPEKVSEPAVSYRKDTADASSSNSWNPNVPFHGTQEEWWDHFHRIEEGPFSPVSEIHQRISQWLDNQEK
jgi:hypothetical protein